MTKNNEQAVKANLTNEGIIDFYNSKLKEMIGHCVHELNQPLTVITTYVAGSIRKLQQNALLTNHAVIAALQNALKNAEVMKAAISTMQVRLLQELGWKDNRNIHSLIKEVVSLFIYQTNHKQVAIFFNFPHNLPLIKTDTNQLKQILFILVRFGIDVIDENITKNLSITIETELVDEMIKINIMNNFSCDKFSFGFEQKWRELNNELEICRTLIAADGGNLAVSSLEQGHQFQLFLRNRLIA